MPGDHPHAQELRRRVQEDPASIAFAQLAEECRRHGAADEAVDVARAGLAHHPDYLSARVTLGRALLELGRLDEAQTELMLVLDRAPDNLAANRAIAELYHTRGQLPSALIHYRRALDVTKHDPTLERQVERIESAGSSPSPPTGVPAAAVDAFFNFDTLLEQLGGESTVVSTPVDALLPVQMTPSEIDVVQLRDDDGDPLAVLERQLRVTDDQRTPPNDAGPDPSSEQQVTDELEGWLSAILRDRDEWPSR